MQILDTPVAFATSPVHSHTHHTRLNVTDFATSQSLAVGAALPDLVAPGIAGALKLASAASAGSKGGVAIVAASSGPYTVHAVETQANLTSTVSFGPAQGATLTKVTSSAPFQWTDLAAGTHHDMDVADGVLLLVDDGKAWKSTPGGLVQTHEWDKYLS